MRLLRERHGLQETVDAHNRVECVLWRGTREELLQHRDALPEHIVHTRGDLLQRAVPLRRLKICEQILLRRDHLRQLRILCLIAENLAHPVVLRENGRDNL